MYDSRLIEDMKNTDLAAAALEKIRQQDEEILALRQQLAALRGDGIGAAIQKSVENPTQAPRNRFSSEVARAAIFQPRDLKKARQAGPDRLAKNRRDLRQAKGLRESPYDRP